MKKIDEIDLKILIELQKNSRITVKELSEKLELSTTPIFERTKKLEKAGIIQNYTAVINHEKLGKKLFAFAHISLKEHSSDLVDQFTQHITSLEQVMECHYTTGDTDFILKILLEDMSSYRDFVLNNLFEMKNIGKIETYLSLSVLKNTSVIPLT